MNPSTSARRVVAFNDSNLALGHPTRLRAAPAQTLVVVNPSGAMRNTNPANLACVLGSQVAWALPVDFRRLTLASSGVSDVQAFVDFWGQCDVALSAGGPGQIWASTGDVGHPPTALGAVQGWIEYRGARPWVAVCALGSGQLVMPMNTPSDGQSLEPNLRFRVRVPGIAITTVPGPRILQARDGMVEIAHFAVLDPAAEGWTVDGSVTAGAMQQLRSQVIAWPQRDAWSGAVTPI